MRSNTTPSPSTRLARAYYPPQVPMPRSWTISLVILVACLLASMVIALIRLF
jgi:hypothetical protein